MIIKTILVVFFIIATNVSAQTTLKKLGTTKEVFIQQIDSIICGTQSMLKMSHLLLEMEGNTLTDIYLETVGKDSFWNQAQMPVTQENTKEILNNYIQSFDKVSIQESDEGEEQQRVIPSYKDDYEALLPMVIYCDLQYKDIYLHNDDSSIIISYIAPHEVDKIILDKAQPSTTLDNLKFTIEGLEHERMRLIIENFLENGQGISRERFIEAVAVYADGNRSSFPMAEIRQSQAKKVIEYLDDIITKVQCMRKRLVNANPQQLEEIRNEFTNSFQTLSANFSFYGTKIDKITRLFDGKIKQVEIYYRTDPIRRKAIVHKELL